MKLTFNDNQTLLCPRCGGVYLHQGRVEVFDCGEERDHDLHVTVDGHGAQVDGFTRFNPSRGGQRQAVLVAFKCESCHGRPVLAISQDCGETGIEWLRP